MNASTKQFELAEAPFMQLSENFPNSLFIEKTWYAIGKLNYELQNYEESRRTFKTLIDSFPNFKFKDYAQHYIAQSFYNEENYEQAYQAFDKVKLGTFKSKPKLQADIMYKAAYSLDELGRDDEAIKRYNNLIKQFPESQWVWNAYFNQGEHYYQQKDYENAWVSYESALQKTDNPMKRANIQYQIANCYDCLKDYENARVNYESALQNMDNPTRQTEIQYRLAKNYYFIAEQSGNAEHYDKALQYIQKIPSTATIVQEQEELTYYCGKIHEKTEHFKLAVQNFMQLVEKFPNSQFLGDAWYSIGELNYKLKNYEESRRACKTLLNDSPNYKLKHYAQHYIANSFYWEKNYKQAYHEFDQIEPEAFKNTPKLQADIMFKSAYSLGKLGRNDEAIEQYNNLIKQFPKSEWVWNAYFNQGAYYSSQKDYDTALEKYEFALQNTDDTKLQGKTQYRIGLTYKRQGYEDAAIDSYKKALKQIGNTGDNALLVLKLEMYYALGKFYENRSNYSRQPARDWYQRFLDEFKSGNGFDNAHLAAIAHKVGQRLSSLRNGYR